MEDIWGWMRKLNPDLDVETQTRINPICLILIYSSDCYCCKNRVVYLIQEPNCIVRPKQDPVSGLEMCTILYQNGFTEN